MSNTIARTGLEQTAAKERASEKHLTSDVGTVVLHWLTVASIIVSIVTGLRISADGQQAFWAKQLSAILPTGEVWTLHVLAGLTLSGIILAYWVYLKRAALADRNATARLALLTPPTNRRLRLKAINIALHWFAYTAIAALTLTGIALYLGYASWFLTIHNALAWAMLIYFAAHTLTHFLYGGVAQLLRLFRPAKLHENNRTRVWPLGIALISGAISVSALVSIDWNTRQTLNSIVVKTAPTLDGTLDEPFWQDANSIFVETQQGANLGGTGSSTVEVKSVVSVDNIHFAFRWQDPTRSLMRAPTVKTKDGWRVMATGAATAARSAEVAVDGLSGFADARGSSIAARMCCCALGCVSRASCGAGAAEICSLSSALAVSPSEAEDAWAMATPARGSAALASVAPPAPSAFEPNTR